jgi:hypothetical protein
MERLSKEAHFVEIIFHTKKLEELGDLYKQTFYSIKDTSKVDKFSITNGVYRFEYENKDGRWVKDFVKDAEAF